MPFLGNVRNICRRTTVMSAVERFTRDPTGQDLIEYALVAALVALVAVASMKTLGTTLASAFTTIRTTLATNV